MKTRKEKLYGYPCSECGNEVWLMSAPEEFIYCPFCGENVNDLECARVLTVRIEKDEDYCGGTQD